jgi:hypothetical protein
MLLTQLTVDKGPHNGDPKQPYGRRKRLVRQQYNALGTHNLRAITRIVTAKYDRGAAFNRQYPFVDVLFSDTTDSGEMLDLGNLVRDERDERGRLRS